jgi:hypothetical protein
VTVDTKENHAKSLSQERLIANTSKSGRGESKQDMKLSTLESSPSKFSAKLSDPVLQSINWCLRLSASWHSMTWRMGILCLMYKCVDVFSLFVLVSLLSNILPVRY